ncbi:MAG TPA: xanthine dehydrogenase family protein molybdopterin-binding subunit [Chloroflexota bacterium]
MTPAAAPRLDALDKVTGRAKFVEDLAVPAGAVYAASIRGPYSHARIRSIDSSAAEAVPGVAGVIHAGRLEGMDLHLQQSSIHQEFLATDKVRFDGDLVGLVAAEDLRTARTAAQLVEVDYELLPVVFSYAEATAPGAPLVHDEVAGNLAVTDLLEWGDLEEGFRQAAHVVEGTYFSPSVYHHPMEPSSSFIVSWERGTLEIWAPVHKLFDVREEAAHLLGVDEERVRVHVPYIGGSFGGKDVTSSEVHAAAALSRKIGRPIQFVATEEESFRINARHAMTYRARMGLSPRGAITALDVELELDTGAYLTGARVVTDNAVQSAMGGYRVPHVRVRANTAYTNKVPAATFRGTGRSQTTYGLECLMDSAARQLGLGALELRVRNLVRRGEMITPPTMRRRGVEAPTDWPVMDTDMDDILRQAATAIGWSDQFSFRADARHDKTVARGQGLAVSFRRSSRSGDAQAALKLEGDGSITVLHNAPDLGEGSHTVLQIVVATTLGVPLQTVRISEPDTANGLYFTGVSSQRTTMQMGTALVQAAGELRQRMVEAAARLHEQPPEHWQLAGGELVGPDAARVSLLELATNLPPSQAIQGRGEFLTREARARSGPGRDHWTAGAAAVEVEVDRETGEVRLARYAAVADAGKALHYPSAKAQVEGGAVLGVGLTMLEEMVYQDGQLQNGDPFQYRLPLMRDQPREFHVGMIEKGDGPGPFGSKAMAQTSVPCVVPAVANAIYNATGASLTRAPFTPEQVLAALNRLGRYY